MNRSTPGLPVHHQLPEFTQTHVHRVSDAIQPSLSPLLLLPPIPPSIRVFANESTLRMRWPKYWSFSFSIIRPKKSQGWSPSEWTGWISLQSKGPLKSLLQHHSSKASVFWHSAFLIVQLDSPKTMSILLQRGRALFFKKVNTVQDKEKVRNTMKYLEIKVHGALHLFSNSLWKIYL